jgi:hypothetical protein
MTWRGRVMTWRGRVITWRGRVITWRGRVTTWRGRVTTWTGGVTTWTGREMTWGGWRYGVRSGRTVRTPIIGYDLADGDGFSKPRDLLVEHDYVVWRQPADRRHHRTGRGVFGCSIHG